MYRYEDFKAWTTTDAGQRAMFAILNKARKACSEAGCVMADKLISALPGDSFEHMAAIDRLTELRQLTLVSNRGEWQNRIYIIAQ